MKNNLVLKEITQLKCHTSTYKITGCRLTGFFEKVEYSLGVFTDLSKSCDTVDQQILIKKLQYYGTDGTALE